MSTVTDRLPRGATTQRHAAVRPATAVVGSVRYGVALTLVSFALPLGAILLACISG